MRNHIYQLCSAFILGASLLSASCKKLIAIPSGPPTQLSTTQVFTDSASATGALAGVYNNFGVANGPNLSLGSGYITLTTGLAGDELVNNQTYDPSVDPFYTNTLISTNGYITLLWSTAYSNLYQVNACIEGLTNSQTLSATFKKQAIGEMKVVRAFYYFNLVNLFGGVPLVTTTDYKINNVLPKATEDQVYDQIIADLKDAYGLLSAAYPSSGKARPNNATAAALLAKAYLYKGQWQDAYNLATNIMNDTQYQLETDLSNVFLSGSKEALWQLPANGFSSQTPEAVLFLPYSSTDAPDYTISPSLLTAFEAGDARKTQWLGQINVPLNDVPTDFYYPAKYKNTDLSAPTTEDYMILRLADVYLVRAEAEAQLDQLTEARNDLHAIRTRARLQDAPASGKAALLNAIAHERQVELFCEWGNRWYDLKRSGNIDAVLSPVKNGWKNNDTLFPIPQSELQSNPKLVQNPGY